MYLVDWAVIIRILLEGLEFGRRYIRLFFRVSVVSCGYSCRYRICFRFFTLLFFRFSIFSCSSRYSGFRFEMLL